MSSDTKQKNDICEHQNIILQLFDKIIYIQNYISDWPESKQKLKDISGWLASKITKCESPYTDFMDKRKQHYKALEELKAMEKEDIKIPESGGVVMEDENFKTTPESDTMENEDKVGGGLMRTLKRKLKSFGYRMKNDMMKTIRKREEYVKLDVESKIYSLWLLWEDAKYYADENKETYFFLEEMMKKIHEIWRIMEVMPEFTPKQKLNSKTFTHKEGSEAYYERVNDINHPDNLKNYEERLRKSRINIRRHSTGGTKHKRKRYRSKKRLRTCKRCFRRRYI